MTYDAGAGELYVRIPSLSSVTDTGIYVYYGNAGASEANDPDTWNADFGVVYHLREDPVGTAPLPGARGGPRPWPAAVSSKAGAGMRLLSPHWAEGHGVSDRHFAAYLRGWRRRWSAGRGTARELSGATAKNGPAVGELRRASE